MAKNVTSKAASIASGTVEVYGASDDLIEVEGVLSEEFNFYSTNDEKKRYLSFSDGTVLSAQYDRDGIWRFNRLATGTARYEKTEGTDPDGDYTDRVTLTGDLWWVMFGKEFVTAKGRK